MKIGSKVYIVHFSEILNEYYDHFYKSKIKSNYLKYSLRQQSLENIWKFKQRFSH